MKSALNQSKARNADKDVVQMAKLTSHEVPSLPAITQSTNNCTNVKTNHPYLLKR